MSCPPASFVKIERVSDPSEIPALASIFDVSAKASGDRFHELLRRYVDDPYKEVVERLQAACSAGTTDNTAEQHFIFKAVETFPIYSPDGGQESGHGDAGGVQKDQPMKEKIVGMAHWTVGYINLPKTDPFEQQIALASAPAGAEDSSQTAPPEEPIAKSGGSAPASKEGLQPFDFYAVCRKPVRNTYISQIRGKKHLYLRRIAVHPQYQRRGIARQLLQWGLDRADSEKLVSYLNGRPQARRLYENGGFKAVNIVPMVVPGLEVSDMIIMVRQPQLLKSR